MTEGTKRWYLENTSGSHNKFYEVLVQPDGSGGYEVIANWGRIEGTARQSQRKFESKSRPACISAASKLLRAKENKGYHMVVDGEELGAESVDAIVEEMAPPVPEVERPESWGSW